MDWELFGLWATFLGSVLTFAALSWQVATRSVDATTARRRGDGQAKRVAPLAHAQVAVAVVTSQSGVLLVQHHYRKPLWTFIAGEFEPGESPTEAALRIVDEHVGFRILVTEPEIGRQTHPDTGRTAFYLACELLGNPEAVVSGGEGETAALRWASLQEAEDLLPSMYEPVRRHLVNELS